MTAAAMHSGFVRKTLALAFNRRLHAAALSSTVFPPMFFLQQLALFDNDLLQDEKGSWPQSAANQSPNGRGNGCDPRILESWSWCDESTQRPEHRPHIV
jgi:hypothetical protein